MNEQNVNKAINDFDIKFIKCQNDISLDGLLKIGKIQSECSKYLAGESDLNAENMMKLLDKGLEILEGEDK